MTQLEALKIVVDAASQIIGQEGIQDSQLDEAIDKVIGLIDTLERKKNKQKHR